MGPGVESIRQALAQQKSLLERDSSNLDFRRQRSKCLALAAEIERALGHWPEAAAAARELAVLWPKSPDKLLAAAGDLAKTAKAAAATHAVEESTRCAEAALEVLRQARKAGLKNIASILADPDWAPVRALPGFAELGK